MLRFVPLNGCTHESELARVSNLVADAHNPDEEDETETEQEVRRLAESGRWFMAVIPAAPLQIGIFCSACSDLPPAFKAEQHAQAHAVLRAVTPVAQPMPAPGVASPPCM